MEGQESNQSIMFYVVQLYYHGVLQSAIDTKPADLAQLELFN
jgi:hypothetical protein